MAVSTAYVNQILPKDAAGVYIPGHIIQVVTSSIDPGSTSTSGTTLIDTGLSATITPRYSNSKLLILVCHWECYVSAANKALRIALTRNNNIVGDFNNSTLGYSGTTNNYFNVNLQYHDIPGAGTFTYRTQFASTYGTGETVAVHVDNSTSYISIMEIAQ